MATSIHPTLGNGHLRSKFSFMLAKTHPSPQPHMLLSISAGGGSADTFTSTFRVVGWFKNSEEAGDSARRTHLLTVVTEQNQSSTISESVRPLSLSESVHSLSFRHNLHLTFNYHPGSQAFSTTAMSAYLQSLQSDFECIINYPDENKTLLHIIIHITLKPCTETCTETHGVHGGKVTDGCPDASVPYDSCICSTPPTTKQSFRRHNYKCEGGFPASTPSTTNQRFRRHYHKCEGAGLQHITKVSTLQPKSIWPRVFKQIRLQSTTLRRLQHILCQHHQRLRYCSSQSA